MKTKEGLNSPGKKIEALNGKLAEFSEDEIALVTGGTGDPAADPSKTFPGWQDQVRMDGAAGGNGGGAGAGIGSGGGGGGIGSGGGGGGGGAGGGSGATISHETNTGISGHSGSNGQCGNV